MTFGLRSDRLSDLLVNVNVFMLEQSTRRYRSMPEQELVQSWGVSPSKYMQQSLQVNWAVFLEFVWHL